MDFEMTDYNNTETQEKVWDFTIRNGRLAVLDHGDADYQRAVIATFTQRGTIPNMEGFGNMWAELLTNQITPQELNAQVRNSIASVIDGLKFVPKYSMSDGKLVVEIKAAVDG